MSISASLVKDLRERTGAGMMECKKALEETGGDIEAAVDALRAKGQAKADKRSSKVAAEGMVAIQRSADGKLAVMLEVNCETDFVARDENFKHFADTAAKLALAGKTDDLQQLLSTAADGAKTLEDVRQALVAKIGENVQIRRIALISADAVVGAYVHGQRIGVLVSLNGSADAELARDIAMHIAASKPLVISPEEVPAELVAREKEIYSVQAAESGKPADIVEKMVIGRMKKFLDEVSLLGQTYVKNPDITVGNLLQQTKAKAVNFVRYEVGEGIEKIQTDFAAEVMAQVKGN
ncbi:MAG: elongation factor Ts [Gammaproteobacteria bacterium]|jgi:elongation factor Ts|nr:elongation factor Ts [Gammaproteobacteria bacterium]